MNKTLEKVANFAPYLIVGITLFITVSALISLILADVITGQVTGEHISTNTWFGLFVSLATTGMLTACGALLFNFWGHRNYIGFAVVLFVFIALQGADVYFDAISVDIMRFQKIIFTAEMADKPEAMAHNVYRFLVGGVSLVGEPLAVSSLVLFPVLKKFISSALRDAGTHGEQGRQQNQNRQNNHQNNMERQNRQSPEIQGFMKSHKAGKHGVDQRRETIPFGRED
jgi:signal transduction histidine kinase